MKLRIVCSVMILAMFTGAVRAQGQTPSSKDTKDVAKPQTQEKMPEVSSSPLSSEAMPSPAFSIYPDPYRPLAWLTADYTLSWISRANVPALVTSSPLGTAQADAGVLGRNSTSVLLGEGTLGTGITNGVKLGAGIRLCDGLTFEVAGFYMQNTPASFNARGDGSIGSTTIARPFFEPITSQEAALLVAFPNRFAGSIDVNTRTTIWGIEGNFFERFDLTCPVHLGVGFRYANLNDTLTINQNTTAVNAPPLTFNGAVIPLSDSVQITDIFRTQNQFIGPQLNLRYQETIGNFCLEILGKVALGSTQQSVIVSGTSNHLSARGQVLDTANGGFLALPSNIGTFNSSTFSVVPEVNVKLGYNFTRHLNVFVSYDFLAWTNVVRAGEQIDRTVNLTQVPTAALFSPGFGGPNNPTLISRTADLTIHSFRVGFEWKF
jgi:Putative beta barrel porin-7 (BBP7)